MKPTSKALSIFPSSKPEEPLIHSPSVWVCPFWAFPTNGIRYYIEDGPVLIKLYLLHQWHLSYLYLSEVSWNYAFLQFCLVLYHWLYWLLLYLDPIVSSDENVNVSYILAVHSLPFFFHAFLPLCFLYPTSKYWVSPLCRFTPGAGYATMTCRRAFPLLDVYLGGGPVPFADDLKRPGPVGAAETPFHNCSVGPQSSCVLLLIVPIFSHPSHHLQIYNYHHLCKLFHTCLIILL